MKKKILVIDDDPAVRETLAKILSRSGYDVLQSSNGEEALTLLTKTSVNLIMLDMNMPRMDGLHFLKKIRDNDVTTAPVLMISGTSDTEQIIESYKLGVYDFIKKPEQTEVMLKRIENGLKIGDMINFNEFIRIELVMAKKLQKYLFPEPSMITPDIEITAWSQPLSDIGGDLFDYIKFRDNRVIFYIADVSGHSISAALYTAIVNMVFRNALQKTEDPGQIVSIMNSELAGNLPTESFVTLFCGLYDPKKSTLIYTNGGHPRPFLIRDNNTQSIKGNDSFLGPIFDAVYTTHSMKLQKDDTIYLFTDGILDIMDSEENPVGQKILSEILNDTSQNSIQKFTSIKNSINADDYSINDDCTLLMLQIK